VRRELYDLIAVSNRQLPDNPPVRAPREQELHARLHAITSPEAMVSLALGRLCGTAVEATGGTGAVVRIVARLLECAREVVPAAHAQAAQLPPAAPPVGSAPSPSHSTAAADAGAPDVVVLGDRFDMPVGVPPATLVGMALRKSGCGPCPHAQSEAASPAPRGYCDQCGHYRHVREDAACPEELKLYCMQCERPYCLECGMTERDIHNHTVIPLSQAHDNLTVRLPGHGTHFTLCVTAAT